MTYLYLAGHQPLWWAETEGESGPSSVQWHWCLPAGRPAVCCGCPCGQTHLWQPHWSRGVAKRKGEGSWNQGCHFDLLRRKKTTVLSVDVWHLALVHMVICYGLCLINLSWIWLSWSEHHSGLHKSKSSHLRDETVDHLSCNNHALMFFFVVGYNLTCLNLCASIELLVKCLHFVVQTKWRW